MAVVPADRRHDRARGRDKLDLLLLLRCDLLGPARRVDCLAMDLGSPICRRPGERRDATSTSARSRPVSKFASTATLVRFVSAGSGQRKAKAISKSALNKISDEVRSWRLHHRTHLTEKDLARKINPIVRGCDLVLRGLLPVGPVSPPGAHQCLPDAMDPQKARATAGQEKGPNRVENELVEERPRYFARWAWNSYAPTVW